MRGDPFKMSDINLFFVINHEDPIEAKKHTLRCAAPSAAAMARRCAAPARLLWQGVTRQGVTKCAILENF